MNIFKNICLKSICYLSLFTASIASSVVLADSSVNFNGVDSYVEMTPWEPTGSYEIVAQFSDLSFDSQNRVFITSSSQDREYVSIFPKSVQTQFGSNYPGIWGKFDFESTKYVKIRVKQGSLYASDGVNESTIYNSSISPSSADFDYLFRRNSVYSAAGLESITFSDLNNSSNDRTITFDDNGQAVVTSTDNSSAYTVNVNASDATVTSGSTSTNNSASTDEMSLVEFNGSNSYIEMTPWVPTGSYKVMAWIDGVSSNKTDSVYLASDSNTNEFISYFPSSFQSKLDSTWSGVWGTMDFAETGYIEVTVNYGSVTASDGKTTETAYNSNITPTATSFDRIFRRASSYSEGSLLAIAFIDLNNDDNYRAITFDSSGEPVVTSASSVDVTIEGTVSAIETDSDDLTDEQSAALTKLSASYSLSLTSSSNSTDTTTSNTDSTTSDNASSDDVSIETSSTTQFNGTNSYIEMTPWVPTGNYKVMAWLDDVSSNSQDRVFLASDSNTDEFISYYPKSVQTKLSSTWSGIWGKMDFATTGYIEISVNYGSMSASDGTTEKTVYNSNISPTSTSFDRIFRRASTYSKGSLTAIAFIDLNDDENYRVITFDSSGEPVVTSTSNVDISLEGSTTSTSTSNTLTDQQTAALERLETEYSIGVSTSDTSSNTTSSDSSNNTTNNNTTDSVSTDSDNSTSTNTVSTSNDGDNNGIEFDGVNIYAQMTKWVPTGEHRVVAWLEPTTSTEGYLVSNSSSGGDYISFTKNTVTVSIDYVKYTASGINITNTDFLEVTIKYGSITISDGDNESTTSNSKINPRNISYDRLFRKDNTFSKGILQSIAFVDVNTTTNGRTIAFDEYGSTRVISDDNATVTLYNVNSSDIVTGLSVPDPEFTSTSAVELGQSIIDRYNGLPYVNDNLDDLGGNDYAWQAHYWLRTYINLYKMTDDTKYIDWAVELTESMFSNTDEKRAERKGLTRNSYTIAPKYYLNNTNKFVPGWSRYSRTESLVLTDGMILSPIMRLVDVIKTDKLYSYYSDADEFMSRSVEIVDSHESAWSETKQSAIAGSWYFVNIRNSNYGDSGLYSNPLGYNHSLAMGTALIYLDKWLGGVDDYKNKIEKLETFFETHMTFENDGTCEWNYSWASNGVVKVEDTNHGHIDVGFFATSYKEGYLNNENIPKCMAATVVNKILIGPGVASYQVDGSGVDDDGSQHTVNYDYRDLATFEPSIIERANNNARQFVNPTWSREYLALSEALLDDN
ncbi:hypothetical protein ACWU4D_09585 [Vibrio sp. WJH972]